MASVAARLGRALRLDDVGAASKQHEVYGLTRIPLGRWALPFPGNFLLLKYVPPIKRWGPYRELTASEWEAILGALERTGCRLTVGITAGWVEGNGRVVPFPRKFPDAAGVIREGAGRGLLEIANHGYTHCVLAGRRFLPRLFSGNRTEHREFHEWLPSAVHREHLTRAQSILQDFLGRPVVTFVPPGNVFARATLSAAAEAGLRYVSCLAPGRWGAVPGLTFVDDGDVLALHDRDIVCGGVGVLDRLVAGSAQAFVTVAELGARLEEARR